MAVLLSNDEGGTIDMYMGERFAGEVFHDVTGGITDSVLIDENGYGEFRVNGPKLSVWVGESAFEDLVVND